MSKSKLLHFFTSKKILLSLTFIVLTIGYVVWQFFHDGIRELLINPQGTAVLNEKGSQYQQFSQIRVDPDINFFEDEDNGESIETIPSSSPSPSSELSLTKAQNQTDVQNVYFNYLKYSQAILLIQVRMTTIATFKSNRTELLVELEKLATQQASLSSQIKAFTIPQSLQSYTAIEEAMTALVQANSDLAFVIGQLETYLYTGSVNAKLAAEQHLNQATKKLLRSADTFRAGIAQIEVDLQQLSETKK